MTNRITLRRTSTAGKVPTITDIQTGELGLNIIDGKLYSSTGSSIFEIGNRVNSVFGRTGNITLLNTDITSALGYTPLETLSYNASNTDITTLVPGSNFGTLVESINTGHFVIGVKSNDANDGFYVIDKGNATNSLTDPYSNLLLKVSRTGILSSLTTRLSNTSVSSSTTTGALVVTGGVGVGGNITATSFTGPLTGNASTATTLETARTFTIGSTSKSFNGSANVAWTLSEIGAEANLGFTPVQQGGGIAQGANKIYIGWASPQLNLQVDGTNFGSNWPISISGNASTATTLQTSRTIALSGGAIGTATSFNGSNNITIPVTSLNASNLTTGTVPDACISGAYSGITSLSITGPLTVTRAGSTSIPSSTTTASNSQLELITSGGASSTVHISFHKPGIFASNFGLDSDNQFAFGGWSSGNGYTGIKAGAGTFTGTVTATSFSGSGASLTSLNGSNISSGTIADIRLSSNVVLLTGTQTLSGAKTFSTQIQGTGLSTSWGVTSGISTGALNTIMGTSTAATWLLSGTSGNVFRYGIQGLDSGNFLRFYAGSNSFYFNNDILVATSFSGSGASLTSLNASNLSSGTVPDARISGSYTGITNLTGSGSVDFSYFLGTTSDTVAAPSFTWTGDTNTGIYHPAADQMAFAVGGTNAVLLSTTYQYNYGHIYITSPDDINADVTTTTRDSGSLHFRGKYWNGTANTIHEWNIFNDVTTTTPTSILRFRAAGVDRMTLDNSGTLTATSFSGSGASLTSLNASNLSSGTVPDARLSGTYTGIDNLQFTAAGTSGLRFWTSDAYKIYMAPQTQSEAGRLDTLSDYNIYFRISGGTNRGFVFQNGATNVVQIDSTGSILVKNFIRLDSKSSTNNGLEMGSTSGVATLPYIDFHSGATVCDYDARIIASGGNGTIGQGTLNFTVASSIFAGNITANIGTFSTLSNQLSLRTTGSTTNNRRWDLNVFNENGELYFQTWNDNNTFIKNNLILFRSGGIQAEAVFSSGMTPPLPSARGNSGAMLWNSVVSGQGTVEFINYAGNGGGDSFAFYRIGGAGTTAISTTNRVSRIDISGNYIVTSDKRVKGEFEPINNALSIVNNLKPWKYNHYINNSFENGIVIKGKDSRIKYGFVAQEIEEVIPETVTPPVNKEDLYGMDYIPIIPILTKAIQEQQLQIEGLQSLVKVLIERLNNTSI